MRRTTSFILSLILSTSVVVGVARPSIAASIMINNGLAPPNPANVIADSTYRDDDVYVRDVGCPDGWPSVAPDAVCLHPGASTTVALVSGGRVSDLSVHDTSAVTMSGGSASTARLADDSTLSMSGGRIDEIRNAGAEVSLSGTALVQTSWINSGGQMTVTGGDGGFGIVESNGSLYLEGGGMGEVVAYAGTIFVMSGGSVSGDVNPRGAYVEINGGSVNGGFSLEGATGQLIMTDGSIQGWLHTWAGAAVTMSGGALRVVESNGSSTFEMRGGSVSNDILARDSSTVTITGGSVSGDLEAFNTANIILRGEDFEVDGVPVQLGPLEATSGILSGNLRYGGTLFNSFHQGASSGPFTGTITLIPEPSTALLVAVGLLGLAAGRRA